jgi:hypothetical protein
VSTNLAKIKILQTKLFERQIKKIHANQKASLDKAVKNILINPELGELKKGDLQDVRVYKFKMVNQLMLLAYCYNEKSITLMSLATHENFYRDLKAYLN